MAEVLEPLDSGRYHDQQDRVLGCSSGERVRHCQWYDRYVAFVALDHAKQFGRGRDEQGA